MTYTPTLIDYTAPADTLATGASAINTNFQTLAAASFDYMANGLTGGTTGTLDDIDGDLLAGGERALVTIGNNPAQVYIYVCDVDNAGSESSPYIIAPDDHPGDKRWVLAARIPRTWIGGAAPTANEDSGDGVSNGDLWLYGGNAWICSDNTLTAAVWVLLLKIGSGATEAVAGNDSRLTNNRMPNAHTLIDGTGHTATGLTAGHVVTSTAATTYAFQDLGLTVAGYTAKTAPVDTDYLPLMDSETTPTANLIKKLSWAYVKSVLKTYFDGLYTLANLGGVATSVTVAGHSLTGNVMVSASDVGLANVVNVAQAVKALAFTEATSSPALLLDPPDACVITKIVIVVSAVGSATAASTVSVGVSGTAGRDMAATDVSLIALGTYIVEPYTACGTGGANISLTITRNASETFGGTIYLHYAVPV